MKLREGLAHPFQWLGSRPRFASLSALVAACLVVRPWGDFPLNDDWQYAVVAKRFSEQRELVIDVPVAPSLVGQALLSFPVLRLAGFSHVAARALTLSLAALLLIAIDQVLRAAKTQEQVRAFFLVTLALSPFYFYLANTFMTEIYGLLPAMAAAEVWLRDRERGPSLSWPAVLGASALCGFAYWTRQFSALVLPALVFATAISLLVEHGLGKKSWRAVPQLFASLMVLAGCVWAHAAWAQATQNARPEQQSFAQIFAFDADLWKMQPGIFLLYMTLFCLPLLVLFARRIGARRAVLPALALLGLGLFTHHLMQRFGFNAMGVRALRHTEFPFIGEVLINAGLGPITLSDRYWDDLPSPTHWSASATLAIELVLIAASVGWTHVAHAFARALRERPRAAEVALFGTTFALSSFVAAVQVEQPWVHDRYYFPCALGLAIALAALLDPLELSLPRRVAAGCAAVGLALFTVAGVHDEFRLNEGRWKLVNDAIASGANPLTIDGGYEVNGWLHRTAPRDAVPIGCIGRCYCAHRAWECLDDSNRIGLSVASDYEPIQRLSMSAWLGEDPVLIWSRRKLSTIER